MLRFYEDENLSIRNTVGADKSRLRTLFSVSDMPDESIYMIDAMRSAGAVLLEPLAINSSRQIIAYSMLTRAIGRDDGQNLLISLMSVSCFHRRECSEDTKQLFFRSTFDQLAAMGEDLVLATAQTEQLGEHGFLRELGQNLESQQGEHPFSVRPLSLAGKEFTMFQVSVAHPIEDARHIS